MRKKTVPREVPGTPLESYSHRPSREEMTCPTTRLTSLGASLVRLRELRPERHDVSPEPSVRGVRFLARGDGEFALGHRRGGELSEGVPGGGDRNQAVSGVDAVAVETASGGGRRVRPRARRRRGCRHLAFARVRAAMTLCERASTF